MYALEEEDEVVEGVKLPTHNYVSAALAHSNVRVASAHGCLGGALPHSCVSLPSASVVLVWLQLTAV